MKYNTVKSSGRFEAVHFSGDYAVAKDFKAGAIVIFTCHLEGFKTVICDETAYNSLGTQDSVLQEDILEVFDYLFVWTTDKYANITTIYIFDGETTLGLTNLVGIANDAMITQVEDNVYLAVAYQNDGIIKNYMLDPVRPYRLLAKDVIDQQMSGEEFFCPKSVSFSPEDSEVMEVLSVCTGKD